MHIYIALIFEITETNGDTITCGRRFESATYTYHYTCSTKETFLQDFL